MKKEEFFTTWEQYKKDEYEKVAKTLSYDYGKRNPALIIEALTFWKFIQHYYFQKEGEYGVSRFLYEPWFEKQKVLSPFLGHYNKYVILIAYIESLPDSVWTRILWRSNIDFVSYESFFRRINKKQEFAIYLNYCDLWQYGKIPRVFTKFEIWKEKISWDKLTHENLNSDKRYSSKGAWSDNLLNLDFGFPAYPNGENDDTKVINTSKKEFLSGVGNFIVQQACGGKYWRLYKKVRSNYVWFPNRNVQLKDHICPGFWYTFIMHALFWIISPICFGLWASSSLPHDLVYFNKFSYLMAWPFLKSLLLGLPGFFTTGWIAAACIKLWWKSVGILLENICPPINNGINAASNKLLWPLIRYLKEHKRQVVGLTKFLALIVAGCGLFILSYWLFKVLKLGFGASLSISIITIHYAWFAYSIWRKKSNCSWRFSTMPIGLLIPSIIIFGLVLEKLIMKYEKPIAYFLSYVKASFLSHIKEVLISVVKFMPHLIGAAFLALKIFFLPLIAMTILIAISYVFEKLYNRMDEKKMARITSVAEVIFIILLMLAVGAVISISGESIETRKTLDYKYLAISFTAYLFIIIGLLFGLTRAHRNNPEVKKSVAALLWLRRWRYSFRSISFSKIRNNPWLMSLESEEKITETLEEIDQLLAKFLDGADRKKLLAKNLSSISQTAIERLKGLTPEMFKYLNDQQISKVLQKIINGFDVKDAIAAVLTKEKRSDEIEKKIFSVINFVVSIFRFIVYSFKWLIIKTWHIIKKAIKHIKTLYWFWELFNKLCPTTMKKKNLSL